MNTYWAVTCVHWTTSNFILLWNCSSGKLSDLVRHTELWSWGPRSNTKSLPPKLLLFLGSNLCLAWWGFQCNLQIWVIKRFTWLLFTEVPSDWNASEPHTCFLSGPQTFAIPLPRIPSLLFFFFFYLLCFLNQSHLSPPPGSHWHNSRSRGPFPCC